jgi:hypothetical protein
MAINASNNTTQRELIPPGNYVARCYQMIHLGNIEEFYMGEAKIMNRVRIGWELPEEKRVFKEENGEQPYVISKEFTLSLHEKSNLRKLLASWRGKDFTEGEAKKFDVTVLLGKSCMLNIIHKHGVSDPSKTYEEIGGISPLPKSLKCPPQINESFLLDYDNFSQEKFDKLPDFIKDKIKKSQEYAKMTQPATTHLNGHDESEPIGVESEPDDLPF